MTSAPAERVDFPHLQKAIGALVAPGDVHELRVLGTAKGTVSGYFDDPAKMAQAAAAWSGKGESVFVTLNPCNPDLLARSPNRMTVYARHTTADADILRRRWLLVDFDPKRPAGISSTERERHAAHCRAIDADRWLQERGWPAPLLAASGNGAHLLYRVEEPNDEATADLLRDVLLALAREFDGETDPEKEGGGVAVEVDRKPFNAARICTLYGTLKAKGGHTDKRPHRLARLMETHGLTGVEPVSRQLLEGLAALAPKAPPPPVRPLPRPGALPSGPFDMEAWMARVGVHADRGAEPYRGGQKWQIDCPFDPAHKAPDAALYVTADGAAAFRCSHNSCSGKDWHALRDLLEPGWRSPYGAPATRRAAGGAPPSGPPPPGRGEGGAGDGDGEGEDGAGAAALADPNLTDAGNAERLVTWRRDDLRHVRGIGWRTWDGRRWVPEAEPVLRLARETVQALYGHAGALLKKAQREQDRDARKLLVARAEELAKHAQKSESAPRLAAMVNLAKSFEEITVEPGEFDLRPWLVPFPNGVWDNGAWRGHRREDYVESLCRAEYRPDADRAEWLALVERMTGGDAEFAGMIQDVAGYALSGASSLRLVPWLYGPKGTGKSTFAELMMTVLGQGFAQPADWALLSGERRGEELGRAVRGLRAYFVSEAGRKRLDPEILKLLSGSDRLPCRDLYQNQTFSVPPTWALIAVSNDAPNVTAYDEALHDRVVALPFVHRLDDGPPLAFAGGKRLEEARRDPESPLALGFLAWAVEGLERVCRTQKVRRTAAAEEHTRRFWNETDPMTPFWEQVEEPLLRQGMTAGALRSAYLSWCEAEGIRKPAGSRAWGAACRAAGLEEWRTARDKGWRLPKGALWAYGDAPPTSPPPPRNDRMTESSSFLENPLHEEGYREVLEKEGRFGHSVTGEAGDAGDAGTGDDDEGEEL